MPAHTASRQPPAAVMIGFALGRNAITHYLYQCNQKTAAA